MKYTGERNGKGQTHGQGTKTWANGDKHTGEFWNCRLVEFSLGANACGGHRRAGHAAQAEAGQVAVHKGSSGLSTRSLLGVVFAVLLVGCSGLPWTTEGTYTWPDGDTYTGEWKDGKQHGQGTYTGVDGSRYIGEWKDGERNGQGTYTFADGCKYTGEHRDGKQHGQGTFTRPDGTAVTGEWRNGELVE